MLLHYLSVFMKADGRCGGQYSGSILVGYPKVLYIGSMTGAQWLVGGSIDSICSAQKGCCFGDIDGNLVPGVIAVHCPGV